ncbi:MAG: phospholipase D family protein [Variovorax sp.]
MNRMLLAICALALGACTTLPPRDAVAPSHALADASATPLARVVAASRPPEAAADRSGFRLLSDPDYAFDARIVLIEKTERTLDVQYYVLENDAAGAPFLGALAAAAKRGVRVRLIVDDLHVGGSDALYGALARQPGFELRLFNPLAARGGSPGSRVLRSLHEIGRVNHRMHNKLFVADNSVSISGGRNIAAEYFMRSTTANFIDMDVLAAGPIVQAQSAAFDRYWNSAQVYPVAQLVDASVSRIESAPQQVTEPSAAPTLRAKDRLGQTAVREQLATGKLELYWATAELFTDDPAKITRSGFDNRFSGSVSERTLEVIGSARKRVLISSPYFIPGEIGLGVMKQAERNGVTTTIVTNSLAATDEPLVYQAYARYRDDMLKLGVNIYEIGPVLAQRSGQLGDFGTTEARLHAKMAIVDERWIYVGSMNLDGRSASYNTETGLLIDSAPMAANFAGLVEADRFQSSYRLRLGTSGDVEWVAQAADGSTVVHADEPGASWTGSLKNWFLALFLHDDLL